MIITNIVLSKLKNIRWMERMDVDRHPDIFDTFFNLKKGILYDRVTSNSGG
jgi:hypothetical protein